MLEEVAASAAIYPAMEVASVTAIGLRSPDHELQITDGPFGSRIGELFAKVDDLIDRVRPRRLVVLGDTDSALSAVVAARRGVPVLHLEAGNRCYDTRVPEEVNRRLIDHASTVLMPYTERSAANLVRGARGSPGNESWSRATRSAR